VCHHARHAKGGSCRQFHSCLWCVQPWLTDSDKQPLQAFSTCPGLVSQASVRRMSCKAGVLSLRAEREDGASEAQVKKAYETYNMLMGNNNFGKGYWMDEKPFFANIAEAFKVNFGTKKEDLLEGLDEDAPSGNLFTHTKSVQDGGALLTMNAPTYAGSTTPSKPSPNALLAPHARNRHHTQVL
jgi:hypothetical protein